MSRGPQPASRDTFGGTKETMFNRRISYQQPTLSDEPELETQSLRSKQPEVMS